MGSRTVLCALSIAVFAVVHARAQAEIDVPPQCGSDGELRSELERLLGPEKARKAWPRSLRITRTDDADYALRLELAGESRAMRDADCRALFKTAVVVAAAAIDPNVRREPIAQPAPVAPAAPREARPEPKPASPPPPAEDDEEEADPVWSAGAAVGAGAAFSLLPSISPLVQLSGTLAYGRTGLVLSARYMAPVAQDGVGDRQVSIYGLGARLGAFHDPVPWLRLQTGLVLDRLTGKGSGGDAFEEATDSGVALALGLDAMVVPVRAGALRVGLGLGGHYAFTRPSFEVTGYGPLFRVPSFGGSAGIELGLEFR